MVGGESAQGRTSGLFAASSRRWQWATRPDRLRSAAAILVIVAATTAAWFTLQAVGLAEPEWRAAYLIFVIVAPSSVGLLWWYRRPDSRVGPYLVAYGLIAWLLSFEASTQPLIVAIGSIARALLFVPLVLICMNFPSGRFRSTGERTLFVALMGVLALATLPVLIFPEIGYVRSICAPVCPTEVAVRQVVGPQASFLFAAGVNIGYIIVSGTTLAVMAVHWRGFSPLMRRTTAIAYVVAAIALGALIVFLVARMLWPAFPLALTAASSARLVAHMAVPFGFLGALIYAELNSANAVRRVVRDLTDGVSLHHVRDLLASAFDDPGLRIGLWDPGLRRYVKLDGTELAPPAADSGSELLPIDSAGKRIAAMVADEAVTEEPSLREAAAAAVVLAVEQELIDAQVAALRADAVAATDAERQRIVRDVHDGAQQHLVALRVRLALMMEQGDRLSGATVVAERLSSELDRSIDELRGLSRRFLPPSSIAAGLGPALRVLTTSWPVEVTVHDRGLRRYDEATERAVFSCCVDAIRNAMEHAGRDVVVRVRLFERNGWLRFVVRDSGTGVNPPEIAAGAGLTTMNDRMIVAGGCLSVIVAPDHGVVVVGTIPVNGERD